MIPLFVAISHGASCPDPVEALDSAESFAQSARSRDASAALVRFERALACTWVARDQLARFWVAQGAVRHSRGDAPGAAMSFAAARRMDPDTFDGRYPSDVRDAWLSAPPSLDIAEFTLYPPPPPGSVRIDGRVIDAPWEVAAGAHVIQLGYGDAPTYGTVQVAAPRTQTAVELIEVPRPIAPMAPAIVVPPPPARRPTLLVGVGAAALAGGALLGVAAYEQQKGIPNAPDVPALRAARRRQVECGVAGYTLLGLSGLGLGAHFVL